MSTRENVLELLAQGLDTEEIIAQLKPKNTGYMRDIIGKLRREKGAARARRGMAPGPGLRLPETLQAALVVEAQARGFRSSFNLIVHMLQIIVDDDLFTSILED